MSHIPPNTIFGTPTRIINVRDYGAVGDGVTDDTIAIQAAIDKAKTVGGAQGDTVVYIPASPTPYMFSNLKLWKYSILEGTKMTQTQLQRLPGSAGNAITEYSAAEGNPDGPLGVWIRNLCVRGNGTNGNGIDLGFVNVAKNFESWASLENVTAQDFPNGIGIHIKANAIVCRWIEGLYCQDGVHIEGAYSQFYGVYGEQNTRYQVRASGVGHTFFGVHIEPGLALTTPLLIDQGGAQSFYGVTIYAGAHAKLIEIASGANKTQLHDCYFFSDGAPAFTDGIYSVDFPNGRTGAIPFIQHYEMGDGAVASWYINADTGNKQTRLGSVYRFEGKIDANGRLGGGDVISAANGINGQTESNSAVNAAMTGSYDATAANRDVGAVKGFAQATRGAGANSVINRGGWFSASGGQANRAIQTDDGDNIFNLNSGGSVFQRSLRCSNELAPAQITANQNDYNPAGLGDAFLLLLTSDAARDITGFEQTNNKLLYVYNNGAFNITLKHLVTSNAAKQIVGRGGADTVLTPKTGALLYYSFSVGKWLILGDTL